VLKPAVNLSELFGVLCFRCAVAFHVPLQIRFVAEAARAERAPAEVVRVGFLIIFLFRHGFPSLSFLAGYSLQISLAALNKLAQRRIIRPRRGKTHLLQIQHPKVAHVAKRK
jgi:hypothetical protein